jgi:hypothetical protein
VTRVSRGGQFYTAAQLEELHRVVDAAEEWEKARERDGWPPLVARFGVETEEFSW